MNLRVLASTTNPKFEDELLSAPDVLDRDDGPDFFDVVLRHFRKSITERNGILILQTIQKLIKNPHHLKSFAVTKYLQQLPYSEPAFSDEIFNIFYILVEDAPWCLTNQVVDVFVPCIDHDPHKCLILIANYATHFAEIDNPWPFLDLLFKYPHDFTTPELIRDYCTTLCFLCHKFEIYRDGRLEHCWTQMTACLSAEDIETIRTCYDALCSLAKLNVGNLTADFLYINQHLRAPATAQHALALLITMRVPSSVLKDPTLIQSLVISSQFTEKGTLVLAQMLERKEVAAMFLASTKWMMMQLPKVIDTLRVFLVVFKHTELRAQIADAPELIPFLKLLVDQQNVGVLSIVSTIIRKLDLKESHVRAMSKKGLISSFLIAAWKIAEDISFDSAYHLAHYISQISFTSELDHVARKAAEHAMSNQRISKTACYVAAELARHDSCYRIMASAGLEDFFERNHSRSGISRFASRFFANHRPSSGRKSARKTEPL